jgi:heme oxygenase
MGKTMPRHFRPGRSAAARIVLFEVGNRPISGEFPMKSDSPGRLHRLLRAATRSDHMMIDRMILRFDLTRREDYGLFLNIHYSTLRDLRAGWRGEDHHDFLAMAHCLQDDLHALGIAATKLHPMTRAPLTVSNRLGVAYVIRGSRLDAIVLRRRVPPQFAASYLDFTPALSWAQFLQQLERRVSEDPDCDESRQIISGARCALAKFASVLAQAFG